MCKVCFLILWTWKFAENFPLNFQPLWAIFNCKGPGVLLALDVWIGEFAWKYVAFYDHQGQLALIALFGLYSIKCLLRLKLRDKSSSTVLPVYNIVLIFFVGRSITDRPSYSAVSCHLKWTLCLTDNVSISFVYNRISLWMSMSSSSDTPT